MIKKLHTILLIFFITSISFPQSPAINKIEPPDWWIGMEWNKLQLMIYGEELTGISVTSNDKRIIVDKVHKIENPNYAFVDVIIQPDLTQGEYEFTVKNKSGKTSFRYSLKERENNPAHHKGFSNKDVMYLIMADRFCDGNSANNTIGDSLDVFTHDDLNGRKGGDIEGIISRLDFISELGVTALWVTPMLENNMYMSYHGYAATDLYKIDPRFGSNELYKRLVRETHSKNLKVILDHVSNHIGINHPWIKNLPTDDWINGKPGDHKPANHNKLTLHDIHSDSITMSATWEGWFTDYMPDLNQRNPFLKNYLIQNTLWWIEYSGVDGIREDTYPYADQFYLSEWAQAIFNEYPDFNIVGEIWTGTPAFLAAYQGNSKFDSKVNSHLPSVTDFGLSDALRSYLSGEKSLIHIYETIVQDFLYSDPYSLLTFFDNHDISRGLFVAKENVEKFKIALSILLTTRGIPKLLYGTEIGMVGDDHHGNIRTPFPGGFPDDKQNAFTKSGRTEYQNEIYDYVTELLKIRNKYPALQTGRLLHFYPFNDQYIYFRILDDQKIIVVGNDDEQRSLDLTHIKHIIGDNSVLTNLKTGERT
ncbi:MAG TPA: alpha-amylase family glycosyl hydrolase, partial [Ignavibacteriaceae bacterium]|nr:alpha-amylase family glycosyl hydrolase [Ignavibacteriaceae bacterium]